MNSFAKNLKTLREEKGLTQRELAKMIGIAHSTLGMYEIGERELDFDTVSKFADFFDVSVDYLIGQDIDTFNIPKYNTLGFRLKELRNSKKLHQEDIGDLFNIGKYAISQWENGISTPNVETISKLADFYGVTVDYILGRDNTEKLNNKGDLLGKRLKNLRKKHGITQEQLGKVINVRKAAVSKYETGHSSPDLETLKTLAKFFNVSIDYISGLIDDKDNNAIKNKENNLGQRLSELRLNKNLTQTEVSNMLNISTSTIGMYEQGRRDPDTNTLIKFAELYNVTTDCILGLIDTRPTASDINELIKKGVTSQMVQIILDLNENQKEKVKNNLMYLNNICICDKCEGLIQFEEKDINREGNIPSVGCACGNSVILIEKYKDIKYNTDIEIKLIEYLNVLKKEIENVLEWINDNAQDTMGKLDEGIERFRTLEEVYKDLKEILESR